MVGLHKSKVQCQHRTSLAMWISVNMPRHHCFVTSHGGSFFYCFPFPPSSNPSVRVKNKNPRRFLVRKTAPLWSSTPLLGTILDLEKFPRDPAHPHTALGRRREGPASDKEGTRGRKPQEGRGYGSSFAWSVFLRSRACWSAFLRTERRFRCHGNGKWTRSSRGKGLQIQALHRHLSVKRHLDSAAK